MSHGSSTEKSHRPVDDDGDDHGKRACRSPTDGARVRPLRIGNPVGYATVCAVRREQLIAEPRVCAAVTAPQIAVEERDPELVEMSTRIARLEDALRALVLQTEQRKSVDDGDPPVPHVGNKH